jgi:hypothetical protein
VGLNSVSLYFSETCTFRFLHNELLAFCSDRLFPEHVLLCDSFFSPFSLALFSSKGAFPATQESYSHYIKEGFFFFFLGYDSNFGELLLCQLIVTDDILVSSYTPI